MSARASSPVIDRLIKESKQLTTDLMALRHELERHALSKFQTFGGPHDRAMLIYGNANRIADDIYKLARGEDEPEPEIKPFDLPRPRALGNGQLRLTGGGR
jgi:hypothetical protein